MIIPKERDEQIVLHKWCKAKKLLSFAIPNGGSRNTLEAINLKKEGVTKGVSDYVVILAEVTLFIEMKRQPKLLKSGKYSVSHTDTSKEQIDFIDKASQYAHIEAEVCYGAGQAIAFIERFLPTKKCR